MYPTERTELLKHISVQWYNKKGESPKVFGISGYQDTVGMECAGSNNRVRDLNPFRCSNLDSLFLNRIADACFFE